MQVSGGQASVTVGASAPAFTVKLCVSVAEAGALLQTIPCNTPATMKQPAMISPAPSGGSRRRQPTAPPVAARVAGAGSASVGRGPAWPDGREEHRTAGTVGTADMADIEPEDTDRQAERTDHREAHSRRSWERRWELARHVASASAAACARSLMVASPVASSCDGCFSLELAESLIVPTYLLAALPIARCPWEPRISRADIHSMIAKYGQRAAKVWRKCHSLLKRRRTRQRDGRASEPPAVQ